MIALKGGACLGVSMCVWLQAAKLWSLSMWRGEHMETGIDHLTEQKTGRLSEVSCFRPLTIVSV